MSSLNNQEQKLKSSISEAEFIAIENVMQRANQIEQRENQRINKLFEHYSSFNKPQGNGESTCLICNCIFGLITTLTPRICDSCLKNVCLSCSVESLSLNKPSHLIRLCRICSEYRDVFFF